MSKKRDEARTDSIKRLRAMINAKIDDLNEFEDVESQEMLFEQEMDRLRLDWRKDEKGKDDEEEDVYLYISSAVRDRRAFPSPGQYQVVLESEVDNVVGAALVQASFPLTDPTVNSSNRVLRYSLSPHNAPVTVKVPVGAYKGAALAVEITTQFNLSYFGAGIPGTYRLDEDGLATEVATGNRPPLQFRVSFNENTRRFIFQLIDQDEVPSPSPFALHIEPLPLGAQGGAWSGFNSDLYSLLGFDRDLVKQEGVYDPGSGTYYLLNTTAYDAFGPAASTDQRVAYSVGSSQFADLRGHLLIMVDIDKLNDNDVAIPESGPDNRFNVNNCFGFVTVSDPACSTNGMLEINSNSGYVKKVYRNGRSRIKQMLVSLRRPDGTLYDFGGLDHFMAIKLTCKRTQPFRPVFGR